MLFAVDLNRPTHDNLAPAIAAAAVGLGRACSLVTARLPSEKQYLAFPSPPPAAALLTKMSGDRPNHELSPFIIMLQYYDIGETMQYVTVLMQKKYRTGA
ncbi:hypothetical protein [Sphingobium sp. LSP13-1-1.1]|uniref:hypothetical protein n=1 Tax=Sphingobium sp. LSP13-1-1.1 TaxID=3135234 RepID=UPI0034216FD2